MREFTNAAKGLTKNPLGVIGLFIVLVYGFACLVLGFGASHLTPEERSPLIWFIVIFPGVILGIFYRLVTAHHKKLYAPSDFKDERLFLSQLSDEQRTERLETEVKRVVEQEEAQTPNLSLHETPRPPAAVRSTYADSERLAFLELENEIGKPFQKYVQVYSHGRTEEFDGVLIAKNEAHLIEVKYFSRPMFNREFLEALIHRASTFMWDRITEGNGERDKVIFWIVIVYDFPEEALQNFKNKVEEAVRCDLFTVNIRFYHLNKLKLKYG